MSEDISFSIITVSYNSEEFIEECILSVLNQNYKNFEYIIVDGKSNDRTLDVVNKYEKLFEGRLKLVSEEDSGLYDAMNKGINIAQNDVIGFLNSDDFYTSEDVLSSFAKKFRENKDLDACYASLVHVKRDDPNYLTQIADFSFGTKFDKKFSLGWHPPHLTFFAKRKLYEKYGGFNLEYPIAADYDLLCRFIAKNNINIGYIPKTIIKMRDGGVSNKKFSTLFKNTVKSYEVLKNNNVFPYLILLKPLRKIFRTMKARIYNLTKSQ